MAINLHYKLHRTIQDAGYTDKEIAKAIYISPQAMSDKMTGKSQYDENFMPKELRKAHQDNDRAVMDAYGFTKGTAARTSESACVAELMKLYQQRVSAVQSR